MGLWFLAAAMSGYRWKTYQTGVVREAVTHWAATQGLEGNLSAYNLTASSCRVHLVHL
jgi:hypothetical protein